MRGNTNHPKGRPIPMLVSVGMLLLSGACRSGSEATNTFRGTAEVREIDVAPLAAGRLLKVRVDEGDSVTAGDTVAILHAPTLAADSIAAQARLAEAQAQLRDLEAGSRPAEISRGEAELASREADAVTKSRDRDRLKVLSDAGAVARRDYEEAATRAEVAERGVDAARQSLTLLKDGTRTAQIAAARAAVNRAAAALAAQRAVTGEYVLTAPASGVILLRLSEPGDLLAIGVPVVRIGLIDAPWVRIYLPASQLSQLQLGDSVTVRPAAADPTEAEKNGTMIRGAIVAINARAEYVTRVALSEDERADLLFGVKIEVHDPAHRIKPGLPVTVELQPESRPQ